MSKSTQARRRSPDASIVTRRALFSAPSFDPATNTFSAVITSGTRVKRRDPYDGSVYFESLTVSSAAVRLDRVKAGVVPLLNSHRSDSISDQLGVVTGTRFEDGRLIADLRLSPSNDGKAVADAIAAGTPPNISIGYQVHAVAEGTAARGGIPTHTITDWELLEVSLVAIPADPQTYIRSQKGLSMDDEIVDEQNEHEIESESRTQPSSTRTMSDRNAREVYGIAARAGLPAEFARRHIDSGGTLLDFRRIVFDRKAEEADRTRTNNIGPHLGGDTFDNPEFLGRSIRDALVARMTGKPAEGAAVELVGRSMLDLGAMLIEARGERVSWSNKSLLADQVMQRSVVGSHTTSDFPVLLTWAGDRVLREAYQAAETPLKLLARRRDAADFRPITSAQLSEAPELLPVGESGEIKHGSRSEAKETGQVKTYARIFSISRNALINDELNAFGDSARDWGRSAAETEANLLVNLLTANSGNGIKLNDGNPVYGTARGNKAATGTVIDVTALSAGRRALRDMKGLDGKTPINAVPKHLVVGSAKETEAEQVLAAIAAAHVDDTNPFSGRLTLHVEPRLSGNAWRLFADPAQITSIIISYLNGQAGPQLAVRDGWSTLGAEFRAVLDVGCWMEDWRGTYLNPGN